MRLDGKSYWNKRGKLVGGIDPFGHVTIASTCMAIFMTKFLEKTCFINVCDECLAVKKVYGKLITFIDDKWTRKLSKVTDSEFVKMTLALINNDKVNDQYSRLSIQWLE